MSSDLTIDRARSGRRPGRPPKRDAVLDAAVTCFLESGYSGTSLESIARAAGVSTATVFKHFRTKADIFGAIMARVFGNEITGARETTPPLAFADARSPDVVEGLERIGTQYARTLRDPKIRALFRVIIAEVPRFPELGRQLYEQGKAPYLVRVEQFLMERVRSGELRVPDVKLATRQFLGMINDVVFWPYLLVVDLEDSDTQAQRVVSAAARVLRDAYAPDAGDPRSSDGEPRTVRAARTGRRRA